VRDEFALASALIKAGGDADLAQERTSKLMSTGDSEGSADT
jgi:hypothetical protein